MSKKDPFERMNDPNFPFSAETVAKFERMRQPGWPFSEEDGRAESVSKEMRRENLRSAEIHQRLSEKEKHSRIRDLLSTEKEEDLRPPDLTAQVPASDFELEKVDDLLKDNSSLDGQWSFFNYNESIEPSFRVAPRPVFWTALVASVYAFNAFATGNIVDISYFLLLLASLTAGVLIGSLINYVSANRQYKKTDVEDNPLLAALKERPHFTENTATDQFAVHVVEDATPYRLQIIQFRRGDQKVWNRIVLDEEVPNDLMLASERAVEVAALAQKLEEETSAKARSKTEAENVDAQVEKELALEQELTQQTLLQAVKKATSQKS